MKKLETLEKNFNKAVKAYEDIKSQITDASERVNVAAQLFSMNEVEKDVLVAAIELRDEIKATKAAAWDKVVEADIEFSSMKKRMKRDAKVADLKARLAELSK